MPGIDLRTSVAFNSLNTSVVGGRGRGKNEVMANQSRVDTVCMYYNVPPSPLLFIHSCFQAFAVF